MNPEPLKWHRLWKWHSRIKADLQLVSIWPYWPTTDGHFFWTYGIVSYLLLIILNMFFKLNIVIGFSQKEIKMQMEIVWVQNQSQSISCFALMHRSKCRDSYRNGSLLSRLPAAYVLLEGKIYQPFVVHVPNILTVIFPKWKSYKTFSREFFSKKVVNIINNSLSIH